MVFIDTNVLVYAFDSDAGRKLATAQQLLKESWSNQSAVISTQVLQEFYVTVTGKLPNKIDRQQARAIVQTYRAWVQDFITPEDIIDASELEEKEQFAFWDALIIITAQKAGADILYSEDMQDGRQIGQLKIINPFKK